MLFGGKLNELSGNLSLDSKFIRVFEIRPFEVSGFWGVFLMSIFQSTTGLNGLSKSLYPKLKSCALSKFSAHFRKKYTKKKTLNYFF